MIDRYPNFLVGEYVSSISEPFHPISNFAMPVNTSDVYGGYISSITPIEVTALKGQFKKSYQVGDILFSEIRPANKRFALVRSSDECENHVASTKLMVLRCNKSINTHFFYCWLTSKTVLETLQHLAESRSGTFPQITYNVLAKLKIPFPPLVEQERIAKLLGALDDKIESNLNVFSLVEEITQSTFDQILESQPKRNYPLDDLVIFNSRKASHKSNDNIYYVDIGKTRRGFIEEFSTYKWRDSPSRARRGVSDGDVIFSTVRPNRGIFSLMLNPDENVVVSTGFAVMTPRENLGSATLRAIVSSSSFIDFAAANATGSAYPAVNISSLKTFICSLPEDSQVLDTFERKAIAMWRIAYSLLEQNNRLSNLRDTLLPELMSGRLHVDEARGLVMEALDVEGTA